jgi:hypothetical protein
MATGSAEHEREQLRDGGLIFDGENSRAVFDVVLLHSA